MCKPHADTGLLAFGFPSHVGNDSLIHHNSTWQATMAERARDLPVKCQLWSQFAHLTPLPNQPCATVPKGDPSMKSSALRKYITSHHLCTSTVCVCEPVDCWGCGVFSLVVKVTPIGVNPASYRLVMAHVVFLTTICINKNTFNLLFINSFQTETTNTIQYSEC